MDNMDKIIKLTNEAYSYAKQAQLLCFDNLTTGEQEDTTLALAHAASCTSRYAAAAAIYLSDPDLENEDVAALLRQFEVFTSEIRAVHEQRKRVKLNICVELEYLYDLLKRI